jgi:DNA polymerase III subunit gamma/tau
MYRVLARKWRPQTFEQMVGQKHVTKTLANALKADRLAHAYIFAGLRGTGKTSMARILAKCLNCEQGPTTEPCGRCTSCSEIAESRSMDVMELDAASRRGIDSIRELQQVISYAPVRDRYKVLILDEFHMLTPEAFNALLKTLEEPPPNLMFILATTAIQKVLPTIQSRCQVFEFRRVSVGELADHLRRICDAEGVKISDSGLERLARAGEGSVRDSLSVLEKVLAFCGHEIDDDDLLRMLGGVRLEVIAKMVGGLAGRDAGVMLEVLDGLVDEGHDLFYFWSELISALRDLLMMSAVPGRSDLLARSPEEAKRLKESADGLSEEDLVRAFNILADLEPDLKSSAQPRFLFEAALVRLASLGAVRPIEEILKSFGSPPPDEPRPTASPEKRGGFAADLIASVSKDKIMLGAVLEASSSISASGGVVKFLFNGGEKAMARQLERKENLDLVKRHAERLLGRKVEFDVEVGKAAASSSPSATPQENPQPPPPQENPQPPRTFRKPEPSSHTRRPKAPRSIDGELLKKAKKDPGVRKLLHEFGAEVVEIGPQSAPQDRPTVEDGSANPEDSR